MSENPSIVVNPQPRVVLEVKVNPLQGPPGPPGADGDGAALEALMVHLMDPTPHPVYDDMPSLSAWFANQLA